MSTDDTEKQAAEEELEEVDLAEGKTEPTEETEIVEKNEVDEEKFKEQEGVEESHISFCSDCGITSCLMWRKFNNLLICNLCHLKRIKNSNQNGINSKNSIQSSKAKEVQAAVRMSKRKNKTNKKFVNGFYAERLAKNGNAKSRRTLMKKKPVKSPEEVAKIITSSSVYFNVSIFLCNYLSTVDLNLFLFVR